MRTLLFLVLGIGTFVLQSCGTCLDDVNLGNAKLTEKGKTYFSLQGSEKLIFTNANGKEITYTSGGKQISTTPVNIENLTEGSTDGLCQRWTYFDGEKHETQFTSLQDSVILNYTAQVNAEPAFDKKAEDRLFDSFSAMTVKGATGVQAVLNLNLKEAAPILSTLRYIGDTTLQNHNFKAVYEVNGYTKQKTYFNRELGFVAFHSTQNGALVLSKVIK
jgi:hypothetical protein